MRRQSMDHQDWTPVVLNKKTSPSGKATASHIASGQFETIKKTHVDSTSRKLENDTETFEHKTVSSKLANEIIRARVAKKWSRADLAKNINEHERIVAEYETKKAIPNAQILSKMSRVLGVKLNKNM